jgi:hypothetical protein
LHRARSGSSARVVTVPSLRDFLNRFRPAGAPGAARAAVPVDQRRRRERELEPVLMLLDGLAAECAQLIAAAQRDAAAMAADAARQAADARGQSSADTLDAARAQAAHFVAEAARQAAQTRELARRRIPVLAAQAAALVRDLDATSEPQRGGREPGHPGWPS